MKRYETILPVKTEEHRHNETQEIKFQRTAIPGIAGVVLDHVEGGDVPTGGFDVAPIPDLLDESNEQRPAIGYIRRAALPRSAGSGSGTASLRPGRVVIKGAADAPTLTSDDVASALYD